ncbi:MAG: nucleoside hydrolase [Elainellaceae cyanobacterium]
MTAPRRKIILDTDPGGDDSIALLWLWSLEQQHLASLVAVTAADGNVSAQQTFENAHRLLHLVGAKVPVGKGSPVEAIAQDASYIHGADGLGGLSQALPLPDPISNPPAAADLLIDRLAAQPHRLSVVAIGPLTNLAAAEKKRPGILSLAKEIVIMGGAIAHPGNVTPQAEFNIWFNPEAAAAVLASRSDIVLMPLDVTSRLLFTTAMAEAIYQSNPHSMVAQFIRSLCQFMNTTAYGYRETDGSAFLVHDAATLAYLVYPQLFTFRRAYVTVETQGILTRGQTLVDNRAGPEQPANVWVATGVNPSAFFTCLQHDLKHLVQKA